MSKPLPTLEFLIDAAYHYASMRILGTRAQGDYETMPPSWVLIDAKGDGETVTTPWPDDTTKEAVMDMMQRRMANIGCQCYSIVVEGWSSVWQPGEIDQALRQGQSIKSRFRKNRQEIVMAAAVDRTRHLLVDWEIIRNTSGEAIQLKLLTKAASTETTGRMLNLLSGSPQ